MKFLQINPLLIIMYTKKISSNSLIRGKKNIFFKNLNFRNEGQYEIIFFCLYFNKIRFMGRICCRVKLLDN